MSRPHELWWGYVRRILRDQPRKERLLKDMRDTGGRGDRPTEHAAGVMLSAWSMREYEAVRRASAITQKLPDGRWRLRLIRLMYFDRTKRTLPGAAIQCHVSERTAQRWHGEYIRLVASIMGMME